MQLVMILPAGERLHWTVVQYISVDAVHYFLRWPSEYSSHREKPGGADEPLADESGRDTGAVIHYGGELCRILRASEVQCGIEKVQ
jgi:hypothetical protein